MKKIFLTTVIIFSGLFASAQDYTLTASAEIPANIVLSETSVEPIIVNWNYGNCYFKGTRPSKRVDHGSMQIYHNGSVKRTATRGGKNVWSGDGDICVVYIRKEQIDNQIFETDGSLQECTKMAK